jgi:hypothetical protein
VHDSSKANLESIFDVYATQQGSSRDQGVDCRRGAFADIRFPTSIRAKSDGGFGSREGSLRSPYKTTRSTLMSFEIPKDHWHRLLGKKILHERKR